MQNTAARVREREGKRAKKKEREHGEAVAEVVEGIAKDCARM